MDACYKCGEAMPYGTSMVHDRKGRTIHVSHLLTARYGALDATTRTRTCMVDGCEHRAALRQAVCAAHVNARTSGT